MQKPYSSLGTSHVPHSLDQSYYAGLELTNDSTVQERDQVTYKYTKKHHGLSHAKILMVNQLWLWRLDERMLIPRTSPCVLL